VDLVGTGQWSSRDRRRMGLFFDEKRGESFDEKDKTSIE